MRDPVVLVRYDEVLFEPESPTQLVDRGGRIAIPHGWNDGRDRVLGVARHRSLLEHTDVALPARGATRTHLRPAAIAVRT